MTIPEKDLFVSELNRLFGDGTVMDCPVVVGRTCYGVLGSDLRVRAEFVSTHIQQEYDALRLTILNRTDGKVDVLQLPFSSVWGRRPVANNPNFPHGVLPHVWVDGRRAERYAWHPAKADYDKLREACKTYLDVFREPVVPVPRRSGRKGKTVRESPAR